MLIANPMYDVVFKYLFQEEKVARLLLSSLLNKEVLELNSRPAALLPDGPKPDGTQFLVLRLHFAAAVRREDGARKAVLIEIQKAETAADFALKDKEIALRDQLIREKELGLDERSHAIARLDSLLAALEGRLPGA